MKGIVGREAEIRELERSEGQVFDLLEKESMTCPSDLARGLSRRLRYLAMSHRKK